MNVDPSGLSFSPMGQMNDFALDNIWMDNINNIDFNRMQMSFEKAASNYIRQVDNDIYSRNLLAMGYGGVPKSWSTNPSNGSLPSQLTDLSGKMFNASNTSLGLIWGGIGLLGGANITLGNNAIQFENHPLMSGAITLGNTVSYASDFGPNSFDNSKYRTVGQHERQHTYQGQILGLSYLPANAVGMGLGLYFNGDTHGSANFMEAGPQQIPPSIWKRKN